MVDEDRVRRLLVMLERYRSLLVGRGATGPVTVVR
jgi:hypothetical protein